MTGALAGCRRPTMRAAGALAAALLLSILAIGACQDGGKGAAALVVVQGYINTCDTYMELNNWSSATVPSCKTCSAAVLLCGSAV